MTESFLKFPLFLSTYCKCKKIQTSIVTLIFYIYPLKLHYMLDLKALYIIHICILVVVSSVVAFFPMREFQTCFWLSSCKEACVTFTYGISRLQLIKLSTLCKFEYFRRIFTYIPNTLYDAKELQLICIICSILIKKKLTINFPERKIIYVIFGEGRQLLLNQQQKCI